MELELIFRLAALGIVVAVLNILLARAGREEQALMVTIAGLVIALVMVVQEISEFFSLTRRLFGF
ncbi:MAG: stage III sporulation protein AC [Oscillospiraceae bacterium]|jgi:stage III sporulation protein AC|nr:stage III sporulation protein AC [Oscillospiraceae bacterium]MBR4691591.1 stage III sporulation protein AC [Oscillospiraceae bacterium]